MIDGIITRAWQDIYQGNAADFPTLVENFKTKYKECIYTAPEFKVQEITEEIVHEAMTGSGKSVGGMDGWQPAELALISREVSKWIAELFKLIEIGIAWPKACLHAKVTYLEKAGSKEGEVMSYRPLTITAPIYRRWASFRLKSMQKWIEGWATSQMFAGVPGQGATDAWYHALMEIEEMMLDGTAFCGSAADIHKFFDELPRELLYALAEMAGMPKDILKAYKNGLDNLNIYNGIGSGIGHKYTRKCGIPQGCPLSMTMGALLMRPWLREMTHRDIDAKVLAADILLVSKGRTYLRSYADVLDYTHGYLHDLGSRVAPAKCYNFANSPKGRKWLEETEWRHIGMKIKVVKDMRYIGGHMCTADSMMSSTLEERWSNALAQLKKLRYICAEPKDKVKAILGKIYPGVFYGIEGSDLPEKTVATLSAAVLGTFRRRLDVHGHCE